MAGCRSRIGGSVWLGLLAPGCVCLNRPQVPGHMTGDVGSAPALARRRRIPAARRNRGERGLEVIERANETIEGHVVQYLSGRPAPRAGCYLMYR